MLKAKITLLTEKEKEKRSERAVTVAQETQTEAPLGPAEDTSAGKSETAAEPRQEDAYPPSLPSCSPKVSSESSEQIVAAPSEKKLGPSLLPRPIREHRKTFSREPVAGVHCQNPPAAAVNVLAVLRYRCALAFALASLPSARGLAPPSKSTTPDPNFAMNPFLNWSDHDPGKVGDGSSTML
jgi:hypothetical protein